MYILGISAFYHDSAASLIKDGEVICAVEEERFSRIKHDNNFPFKAIEFCLANAGITIDEVDYLSYYEKPLLKFERILDTFVKTYPLSLSPFVKSIPDWIGKKIQVEKNIKKDVGFEGQIFYVPHHISHASSAYYPSSFKKSAILTIDGVGEYQTTGLWLGKGCKITPIASIDFPHSLGLLYSTFTSFLGFRVNNDEYKMMGLAAYGKPVFKEKIYQLVDVKEDGSFVLDMDYFSFRESFQMWSKKFEDSFGKPRKTKAKITKRDKNLAASVQEVAEEIYFKMLDHLYGLTRCKNLCVGGGVALNSLANGKIYANTPFKNVYIFGNSGDGGAALGSALFTYHSILNKRGRKRTASLSLGSDWRNEDIESVLIEKKLKYLKFKREADLIKKTAGLLAKGKIIGWFQERMEYGPRALGSRSILAKAYPREMKDKVNKIKRREKFRPFAGSVLQDKVHILFNVPENKHSSPYMNFCFTVKENKQKDISAIVHKDKTCRVQTVSKISGRYYKLLKEFEKLTKVPCILNTSFNLAGEPIVETPNQAIEDFIKTDMDFIVIGDFIGRKG